MPIRQWQDGRPWLTPCGMQALWWRKPGPLIPKWGVASAPWIRLHWPPPSSLLPANKGKNLSETTPTYVRIELPNGEEVPAGRFLREVEGIVQEVLLERLFHTRAAVSAVDALSQFYVLWRYFYGRRDLEAGDVIVFTYPLHVELDGPGGFSLGTWLYWKCGKGMLSRCYRRRRSSFTLIVKR